LDRKAVPEYREIFDPFSVGAIRMACLPVVASHLPPATIHNYFVVSGLTKNGPQTVSLTLDTGIFVLKRRLLPCRSC